MYDGIFEDVEHVKGVLASHGHTSVDETLVFELLENLRVKEDVVKVLLGTRLKSTSNSNSNSNSLDNSWSPDHGVIKSESQSPVVGKGGGDSSYFSNTIEDSNTDDDLEVLEDNCSGVKKQEIIPEPVDLTNDDNQSSSDGSYSINKYIDEEIKNQTRNFCQPLVDLTKESMNNKPSEYLRNEILEDGIEISKMEDQDGNNSATDYESEMDDYYNRHDTSEESQGFHESDDKITPLASPELPICQNFHTQDNNDVPNTENCDNRMEEMLEENNNDPNNNLEDIEEVMEQNNAAASATASATVPITENLNAEKELKEEKKAASSPKPGCSKDSYYADTDFCLEDSGDRGKQKFLSGKRSNVANIFEDEDFLVGNCVRLSDTQIGQDVFLIQRILPNYTKAKILLTLLENQDAMNRVEIALWELLSDVKPAPIFHPKRKQEGNNCPTPTKKFITGDSHRRKKPDSSSDEDESCKMEIRKPTPAQSQAQATKSKSLILKSATLKVSDDKKKILKSPKLELKYSQHIQAPAPISQDRRSSILTLKPSKLEYLNQKTGRSSTAGGVEISNKVPDVSKDAKTSIKENESNVNRTGAIRKNVKQNETIISEKAENSTKVVTQSNTNISNASSKLTIRIAQKPNGDGAPVYQIIRKGGEEAKEKGEDLNKTNIQIPKLAKTENALKNATKDTEVDRKAPQKTTAAVIKSIEAEYRLQNGQKPANNVGNKEEKQYPNTSKAIPTLSQNIAKSNHNVAIGSDRGIPQVPLPVNKKTELNIKLKVPVAAGAATAASGSGKAAINPPKIESGIELAAAALKDLVQLQKEIQNLSNSRIVQRVGNIQIENERLLGNGVPNNAPVIPKVVKRAENQPPLIKIDDFFHDGLGAVGPMPQMDNPRIEKPDIPPPKELYNPLINMFPDVDPNYIAELCVSAKRLNQSLESLVESLLINGTLYPRIINPEPEPQDLNPDVQYENLQGIFPDAHPEYLRGIAEKYYKDPEAMKNFVQAKLEKADYPTMADYLKKIKITEQIKQYTVDFSPEKFLQIFPDPFKHFENPKRICRFNVIALEFLKNHFCRNKVVTIQGAYKQSRNPNHISLAAKSLEAIGPDMKCRRGEKPIPTEDIPLLQEFAFIRHKAKIKEFIATQQLKEKQEFQRLKQNNELLECQCCYDGECMPSKCLSCSEGHVFCTLCIKTGSETKIGEGQTQFPCFIECSGEFSLPVLQKVLEPTMFSILLRKRQEEEVKAAGLEGLVSCPFCHFASIPPPEDKVFKCLNPECMKETCRLCKELNHVPLRCDEVIKGEEARHYLEEKMTQALVRKCYQCSRPFFKDEGCNKMTCPCGAKTCYICGEPVKDYRHFNGQGSDRTDLCPLWSDNQMLNAQTVRVVAEAAQKEMLQKNPNLKIDAKALMPALPQAARGPHQDIANAHVLPVQARRV